MSLLNEFGIFSNLDDLPPPPQLVRQLNNQMQYVYLGELSNLDPDCPSLNNHIEERITRKLAIIAQHPNSGYAMSYREELLIDDIAHQAAPAQGGPVAG